MPKYLILCALFACLVLGATAHALVCEIPDNGSGTIDLPPNCPDGYSGPMAIVDGLPPGTTIEIDAKLWDFINVVRMPGGSLGGEIQIWDASLEMIMSGTGDLAGYDRIIYMAVHGETHSAPSPAGKSDQSFATDMVRLTGQLVGDPDFDLLRLTAGTAEGLPSPGHTTLTQLPSGDFAVDSFFDITYRIDFVGAPGSPLSGLAGSTTGTGRFQAGEPYIPTSGCVLPDNGSGTIDLPPNCPDGYSGPMAIVDGLPPGTTIEIDAKLWDFIDVVRMPGGSLGGEIQVWDASLEMLMSGTGDLAGYDRIIYLPVQGETHSAPRFPGQPVQSFATDMVWLTGQLFGDPDFDLLRLFAGSDEGLPSPGHTTLTQLPSGDFAVDSFFDITYRIDFVGAPGSPLSGLAGSTTGTGRFDVRGDVSSAPEQTVAPSGFVLFPNSPNPFHSTTTIRYFVPWNTDGVTLEILDVSGRLVQTLASESHLLGPRLVVWDGRDQRGERSAAGVYFCRLRAAGHGQSMRMTILR